METLQQVNIDRLDEIAQKYKCEILLPPCNGCRNVCISVGDIVDLTHLFEELFYGGFSFVYRIENNEVPVVEILGYWFEDSREKS